MDLEEPFRMWGGSTGAPVEQGGSALIEVVLPFSLSWWSPQVLRGRLEGADNPSSSPCHPSQPSHVWLDALTDTDSYRSERDLETNCVSSSCTLGSTSSDVGQPVVPHLKMTSSTWQTLKQAAKHCRLAFSAFSQQKLKKVQRWFHPSIFFLNEAWSWARRQLTAGQRHSHCRVIRK